jgi:hypothetical protein
VFEIIIVVAFYFKIYQNKFFIFKKLFLKGKLTNPKSLFLAASNDL